MRKQDNDESDYNDLQIDGLICAFELVHGYRKVKTTQQVAKEVVKKVCFSDPNCWSSKNVTENSICELLQVESEVSYNCPSDNFSNGEGLPRNCWMSTEWARMFKQFHVLATGVQASSDSSMFW